MILRYSTTIKGASLPQPAYSNDSGVDITALQLIKKIGSNTFMYDTGICISPPEGYYTMLVARSSIVKTGYMLSNSVGILDASFRGSLKIVLTRVDDTLPELQLPFTVCQLVLMPLVNPIPKLVVNLDETVRGDREFGSSNK